jgi:hypothetical protein
MSRKNVPASTVREWAYSDRGQKFLTEANAPTPGPKGRIHPLTTSAFRKANPNLTYAEKVAEGKRVTVPVPARDRAGRNITRKVALPMQEFRDLAVTLGVAKHTGRFSDEAVAAVGAALIEG